MRPIKLLAPTLLAAALAFPAASNAALITHGSAFRPEHAHSMKYGFARRSVAPGAAQPGCSSTVETDSKRAGKGRSAFASAKAQSRHGSSRAKPKPATPIPCAGTTPTDTPAAPPIAGPELLPIVFGPDPFTGGNGTGGPSNETPPGGPGGPSGNTPPGPPPGQPPVPPFDEAFGPPGFPGIDPPGLEGRCVSGFEPACLPGAPQPPGLAGRNPPHPPLPITYIPEPPDVDVPAPAFFEAEQAQAQVPEPASFGLLGLGLLALGYRQRKASVKVR